MELPPLTEKTLLHIHQKFSKLFTYSIWQDEQTSDCKSRRNQSFSKKPRVCFSDRLIVHCASLNLSTSEQLDDFRGMKNFKEQIERSRSKQKETISNYFGCIKPVTFAIHWIVQSEYLNEILIYFAQNSGSISPGQNGNWFQNVTKQRNWALVCGWVGEAHGIPPTSFFACLSSKKVGCNKIQNTRRPASTGIFFAQLQIFWSTFANGWKQNNCFDISFQKVSTNINSTTDFCTLWKRVSRFSVEKFLSHNAEKFHRGILLRFTKFLVSKNFTDKRGGGGEEEEGSITIFCRKVFVSQCRKIS